MGVLSLTGNSRTRNRGTVAVASGPWTPLTLGAALYAWYDATVGVTDAGGGAVSQWNDQSGNGKHLTQATGGLRPQTGTRTKNSLNVIDFNGSAAYIDASSVSLGMTTFTVLAVAEGDADHSDSRRIVIAHNGGAASDYNRTDSAVFLHDGNASEIVGTDINGTFPRIAGSGALPWDVYSTRKANASSSNNTQLQKASTSGSTTATTSASGTAINIRLGADQSGATRFDGVIGEVIVCSTSLSDADRTLAINYLRTKWGI